MSQSSMYPSKRARYGYGEGHGAQYDNFVYSVTTPAIPTSESVESKLTLVVYSYILSEYPLQNLNRQKI